MRILIVLSAVFAIAYSSVILPQPIAYKTSYEPRSSYEYSSSVQAPDYHNYVHVKSIDDSLIREYSSPLIVEQHQPQILTHSIVAQPIQHAILPATIVKSEPTIEIKETPLIATEHVGILNTPHTIQPVLRPLVKEHPTIVRTIEPLVVAPTPIEHTIVAVKTPQPEPVIAAHHQTLIAAPIVKTVTPVVESVVEQQVVGHEVVAEGVLAHKTQYHSQDEAGRAAYGHSEALQSHNAYQDETGSKIGSFSYYAPDGRLLTTDYVADENGYRAASNAFPIHDTTSELKLRHRRSIVAPQFLRESVLTQVVNNPGHAISYRVDPINHGTELKTVQTYLPSQPLLRTYTPTLYSANSYLSHQPLLTKAYYQTPLAYNTLSAHYHH